METDCPPPPPFVPFFFLQLPRGWPDTLNPSFPLAAGPTSAFFPGHKQWRDFLPKKSTLLRIANHSSLLLSLLFFLLVTFSLFCWYIFFDLLRSAAYSFDCLPFIDFYVLLRALIAVFVSLALSGRLFFLLFVLLCFARCNTFVLFVTTMRSLLPGVSLFIFFALSLFVFFFDAGFCSTSCHRAV